jgi:Fe2+ or Zn2+ uptake regulation protein
VDAARTVDQLTSHQATRLRQAGLRVTRPRLRVLDLLDELPGHHSADEVADALRAQGAPLPRASVYNVLDALVRHGLALGADAGPGRALFESATKPHHHFVCQACGALLDVPCVVGHAACLQPDLPGATIAEAQVIFRGRCPRCAEQTQSA